MKQFFKQHRFTQFAKRVIRTAQEICNRYEAQGYDLSLRQMYYQFVAADLLANTETNYKKLGTIISDARLAGLIDWNMIKDRGRETVQNAHWDNPSQILESCASQFRIDTWKDQDNHVEVMVEKQALEGVLEPVCRELDIRFTANKGYSSSSSLYEIGRNLYEAGEIGKELHVIYLGDHDPSGIDMTRDIRERLSMFSESTVNVHRVALNMDQVEEYKPPENPAKLKDTRAAKYIEKFGKSSWELDALEPALLADLVCQTVVKLRDEKIHKKAMKVQDGHRKKLLELSNKWD